MKIGPDTVARFRYDPFGRRVLKVTGTTTRDSLWFVYNAGVQVLVDVTGNGAADTVRAEYGYGPGSDQVWTVRKPGTGLDGVLLLDPLIGSVRGVAAWTGGTLQKDYRKPLGQATPWGKTPADTGAVLRVRWVGREYDQETGLYYMRARYYDPRLGRFLSEDPIGVEGGLNLYAYAGDEPVNRSDPTGLDPDCVWENRGGGGTWVWVNEQGMTEIGVTADRWVLRCSYSPPSTNDPQTGEGKAGGSTARAYYSDACVVYSETASWLQYVCEQVHGPLSSSANRCTAACLADDWVRRGGLDHPLPFPEVAEYLGPAHLGSGGCYQVCGYHFWGGFAIDFVMGSGLQGRPARYAGDQKIAMCINVGGCTYLPDRN